VFEAIEADNFYKQVGKEGRAHNTIWLDACNMVISRQLASERLVPSMPLPLVRDGGRIAWYQIGSPARIAAILRASLEARVPIGYQDDSGFHYGVQAPEWFFTI